MNRIAPNNQLPATHFIEGYKDHEGAWQKCTLDIERLPSEIIYTETQPYAEVLFVFLIRENQLPTKHKF